MEGTQVCSTEDSIIALLERLVEPKLPAKSGLKFIPCQSDEEVMAKQMHAVALLYNYYHRRQHPQLEFMNFESFCKLAVIQKPNVLSYMKLTHGSSDTQLDNQEEQLSLTEKKIVNACNVAMSLDASKVTPIVHQTAVSKVAVLLVDSEKQNALLQFGSVTEGVWSAIEKEVEVVMANSSSSMDSNKKRRVLKGPAKREGGTSEAALKKTATLAVKEATGIPEDDLAVLESYIVYSTSKENTSTRFYILQCTKADDDTVHPVPIKDLIKSLQGPLFSRSCSQWITTPVVDYFHLLPFARILADWSNSASSYSSKNSESAKRNNVSGPLMHKDENVNPETAKSNACDESSMTGGGLPNLSDGSLNMELDTIPVNKLENEDMCRDVAEGMKPGNQKIESSSGLITSEKAKTINTQTVIRSDEKLKNSSVDPDSMPVIHGPVVTHKWNDEDIGKMLSVVASKDKELSEAALKVLLRKRDELSYQQRDMEDQIAQHDKKIQTLLDGNGDVALKIAALLEICEDTSFLRSLSRRNQSPGEGNGNKRMSGANGDDCHRLSSCQALDDLCWERNWILPTYRVASVKGGFVASVVVKGDKSEWSAAGCEVGINPTMARELVAEQVLGKIRAQSAAAS